MLVIGAGGGRMDFVAGWLSLLPGFIDVNWGIDPITHQSYGDMRFAKLLDQGKSLEDVWPKQFQLSADANLYLVGTGHGHCLTTLEEKINADLVKLVVINTTGSDINVNKLKWEFIVKTYLSEYKISYYRAVNRAKWLIDTMIEKDSGHITVDDRISAVDLLLKNLGGLAYKTQAHHPSAVDVDYNQLFQLDGSRYLCDQLGMTVNDSYHQHWNHVLPLADSPDTLTAWGHVWRYKDYFTD
jgi:hypothetical protein